VPSAGFTQEPRPFEGPGPQTRPLAYRWCRKAGPAHHPGLRWASLRASARLRLDIGIRPGCWKYRNHPRSQLTCRRPTRPVVYIPVNLRRGHVVGMAAELPVLRPIRQGLNPLFDLTRSGQGQGVGWLRNRKPYMTGPNRYPAAEQAAKETRRFFPCQCSARALAVADAFHLSVSGVFLFTTCHQRRFCSACAAGLCATRVPATQPDVDPRLLGYGPDGYFLRLPGAWGSAPLPRAALWTPPYWGWRGGITGSHDGYWGRTLGYYGGVNYGFGYGGHRLLPGRVARGFFRLQTPPSCM